MAISNHDVFLQALSHISAQGEEVRRLENEMRAAIEQVCVLAYSAASLRGIEVELNQEQPAVLISIDPKGHDGSALLAVYKAVSAAAPKGLVVDVTLLCCRQHDDCIQHPQMGRDCYTSRWLCQDHEACRADPSIARDCLASRTPGPMPEPLAPDTTTAR